MKYLFLGCLIMSACYSEAEVEDMNTLKNKNGEVVEILLDLSIRKFERNDSGQLFMELAGDIGDQEISVGFRVSSSWRAWEGLSSDETAKHRKVFFADAVIYKIDDNSELLGKSLQEVLDGDGVSLFSDRYVVSSPSKTESMASITFLNVSPNPASKGGYQINLVVDVPFNRVLLYASKFPYVGGDSAAAVARREMVDRE